MSACQNKTFTTSGNAAVTLLQTGTSLSGRIDLTNFLAFNGNCTPAAVEVTRVIVGTISGSSIMWSVPNDSNITQFSGSIDSNSITAQWADASGGSGSLTLTRTSGDPPAVDLTGTWSGTLQPRRPMLERSEQKATAPVPFTLKFDSIQGGCPSVITMQNVPLYDQGTYDAWPR